MRCGPAYSSRAHPALRSSFWLRMQPGGPAAYGCSRPQRLRYAAAGSAAADTQPQQACGLVVWPEAFGLRVATKPMLWCGQRPLLN